MPTQEELFFDRLVKQDTPFSGVDFFKDAPFVKDFDFSHEKLALQSEESMVPKVRDSGEYGWNQGVEGAKLPSTKANKPVDPLKLPGSRGTIMQMPGNNMSGFQGAVKPGTKGGGFNPA